MFYAFIKDITTFTYGHTLHHRRKKKFCCCLNGFGAAKMLKSHVIDCFKINDKQVIKMSEDGEYVRFKYYERKKKSNFLIYVDFETKIMKGKKNRFFWFM